jgi:hypothetical protein
MFLAVGLIGLGAAIWRADRTARTKPSLEEE